MKKYFLGVLCIFVLWGCGRSLSAEHKEIYTNVYKTCTSPKGGNLNEGYCAKAADLVIHYFESVDDMRKYQEQITHIVHRDYVPVEMSSEMKHLYVQQMDECMKENRHSLSFCRCQVGMVLYPFDNVERMNLMQKNTLDLLIQETEQLCPLFESLDKPHLMGF